MKPGAEGLRSTIEQRIDSDFWPRMICSVFIHILFKKPHDNSTFYDPFITLFVCNFLLKAYCRRLDCVLRWSSTQLYVTTDWTFLEELLFYLETRQLTAMSLNARMTMTAKLIRSVAETIAEQQFVQKQVTTIIFILFTQYIWLMIDLASKRHKLHFYKNTWLITEPPSIFQFYSSVPKMWLRLKIKGMYQSHFWSRTSSWNRTTVEHNKKHLKMLTNRPYYNSNTIEDFSQNSSDIQGQGRRENSEAPGKKVKD